MAEPDRALLLALLDELEKELRHIDLWQGQPPAAEAFESSVPFFADTMDFSQWLQWVFIARFRAIIAGDHPLPRSCDVKPMAEEAMDHAQGRTHHLLALLEDFDRQFS